MSAEKFEDEVRTFMASTSTFFGEMREFKTSTERRLVEQRTAIDVINIKAAQLDVINARLANPAVCLAHTNILEMIKSNEAKDEVREKAIHDIKSEMRVVEYKLSTKDMAKVSVIAAGIAAPLIELVKWLITKSL